MSIISNQLSDSVEKVGRLIELCAALQEENELLKLENHSLKKDFGEANNRNSELEERLRVLALARSLEGTKVPELAIGEKTLDIKQKITEFVREIDKCIVLLKK